MDTCIICSSNAHIRELYASTLKAEHLNEEIFSARRLPDRIHGRIVRCSSCGLVFADPLIAKETLKKLYKDSHYTYSGEETSIERTYGRYLGKLLAHLKNRPHPLSYIDIGCGNGFMLRIGKQLGFDECVGVEPSTHAIEQADEDIRPSIIQGMFSVDILRGRQFDALSCFQTLDHIPDPRAFVRECLKTLKPGGMALFINHNIGSIPAKLLGEKCPMIDIEHTYLHTSRSMHTLFTQEGFEEIDVFAVRNDYPLHYWIHLFPMPRTLKQLLIHMLKESHLDIHIPLYAGNLGLIAKKPQD